MEYPEFAVAFRRAIELSSPHVHSGSRRKLSGSEIALVSNAAHAAGFARPTPQMLDAIAKCVHLQTRQRQRIIDHERSVFFGLKPARLSLEEMPGAVHALNHDVVPISLERLSARLMTIVVGMHGLGIRC